MGSDDGPKPARSKATGKLFAAPLGRSATSVAVSGGVLLFLFCFLAPAPEPLLADTFQRDYSELPNQCVDVVRTFDKCQETAQDTVVLACHRKWCNSRWGGHCEPCSGIGHRTRFVVSQIDRTSTGCALGARIQIDNPGKNGMAILDSAVYTDASGWWGELLHYRSYDVSQRLELPFADLQERHSKSDTSSISSIGSNFRSALHQEYFTHFTPNNYTINQSYNACYFHAIFKPTRELQAALDRHNIAIGTEHSIGIHYRTGDEVSFGVPNKDNRLPGSAMDGWQRMQQCAVALAMQLFPHVPLHDVVFYLATDNPIIKSRVRQDQRQAEARTRSGLLQHVYLTDVAPNSYLRGNAEDDQAWLEVLLLSKRQGLVSNVLPPKGYRGSASRLSHFSVLAQKIGFFKEHQISECTLDENE